MKPTLNPRVTRVLKSPDYPLEVSLTWVRWYVAYALSLCHLEEMVAERGVAVIIQPCTARQSSCEQPKFSGTTSYLHRFADSCKFLLQSI